MQYPTDRTGNDFVQFSHMKYSARGGGGGGGGGITLYMPENTPAVTNANNWDSSHNHFSGPIGELKRRGVESFADVLDTGLSDPKGTVSKVLENFKGAPGAGALGRHYIQQRVGKEIGLSANQMMSVTRGEIYNPNVEMFYEGPQLRAFTFNFNFAPKSSADAQMALQIIREFKMYSAPKDQGNGKYEIPHVWKIKYSNKNYNKFKPAALVAITVDFNAGLDQYMTFDDDMPIVTSMELSFKEVEIITRKDHSSGSGM